jgi:4-amino-4-deoxy-L-arabinose transferase-like glycosyltransferase
VSFFRAHRAELAALAVILSIGLALRLYWAITVTPEQVSDARGYARAALELAAGFGYRAGDLPTAYYPVGYAATLAVFHKLFGSELAVARLANVCLSALTLLGVYCIARALTRSKLAALLALLALALYPADIAYTSLTLSQPAFNAFALAGVALCTYVRPARLWAVLGGGAVLGWATLTRNQGAVLPILLGLLWCIDPERPQRRAAAVLIVAFICTLAPWTLRNVYKLHAFVPVSTNSGINLYIGNNPGARGRYRYNKKLEKPLVKDMSGPPRGGTNEVILDRRAAALAWSWASQHPSAALALFPAKLKLLFIGDGAALGYWSKRVADPNQAALIARVRGWNERYYQLLMATGLLGLLRTLWTRRPIYLWLPPMVVAAFTALHLLTFGDPCYHHPMMPWIAISAGFGLAWLRAPLTAARRSLRAQGWRSPGLGQR